MTCQPCYSLCSFAASSRAALSKLPCTRAPALLRHLPHTCSTSAPTTMRAPTSSSPSQASSGSTAFSTRSDAPAAKPHLGTHTQAVADAGYHHACRAVLCYAGTSFCGTEWQPAATATHASNACQTLHRCHQCTVRKSSTSQTCMHAKRKAVAWWHALRAASTSANTSVKLLASSAGRRASRSAASCAVACAPVSASGTSTARRLLPDPLNPYDTDRLDMRRAGHLASALHSARVRLFRPCVVAS